MKMVKKDVGCIERLYYEVEVKDKSGKVVTRIRGRSHSYLRPYMQLRKAMYNQKYGAAAVTSTVLDITNTARTIPKSDSGTITYMTFSVKADSAEGDYGIVVGTGDSANNINTVALVGIITHGTGAGQLVHNTSSLEDVSNPSGADLVFKIIRTYSNNSGATIVVKEIGLEAKLMDYTSIARTFLLARDVITPTSVPNGSTLTIRYIPKITVA